MNANSAQIARPLLARVRSDRLDLRRVAVVLVGARSGKRTIVPDVGALRVAFTVAIEIYAVEVDPSPPAVRIQCARVVVVLQLEIRNRRAPEWVLQFHAEPTTRR